MGIFRKCQKSIYKCGHSTFVGTRSADHEKQFFKCYRCKLFWKMSNKNNQNCQMLRTICRFLSESAHHILFFCQKVRTICRFCRMMRTNRHFYLNLFRSLNCKRFLASTNHIGEQRGVFWRCNCTNPYITLFSVQNSQLLL